MSMGPKKSDYKPTADEKASAEIAYKEKQYFREKYQPLLEELRDYSKRDDQINLLRLRANADVQQALTGAGASGYQDTRRLDRTGDMAQALQGQLSNATETGKQIQNQMQTNVLGIARQQAADAQTGMAQAARMSASSALARARDKDTVAHAKYQAVGNALGALGARALYNKGSSTVVDLPPGQQGPPEEVQGDWFTHADVKAGKKTRLGQATNDVFNGWNWFGG